MKRFALNALLLAEDEAGLALDRKVLRQIGIVNTQFFSSGRKALDHLRLLASGDTRSATRNESLIICAERLEDMTGLHFLTHVRSLPGASDIPALFLVGNGQSTTALAAKASGSCAVLARPYSPDQARNTLLAAMQPESRHAPMVLPPSFIDRFGAGKNDGAKQPILRRPAPKPSLNRGEAALQQGLTALQRGDLTAADRLLHGCRQADPGNSEVCLALSKLYAAQNKEAEELAWLCKAAVLCLKRGERVRAGNIISRLPRGRAGQAPLLAEAGLALRDGETKAAALGFLEAHRLDPSQPLHALIGRTCMFTPAPEEHMNDLVRGLTACGYGATADKLRWRLLQPPKTETEERSSFLDRFPLLCDIVSVATHTFKAWRHAA